LPIPIQPEAADCGVLRPDRKFGVKLIESSQLGFSTSAGRLTSRSFRL
jgi:hypothetical protein